LIEVCGQTAPVFGLRFVGSAINITIRSMQLEACKHRSVSMEAIQRADIPDNFSRMGHNSSQLLRSSDIKLFNISNYLPRPFFNKHLGKDKQGLKLYT
jgi:hypothetical protein